MAFSLLAEAAPRKTSHVLTAPVTYYVAQGGKSVPEELPEGTILETTGQRNDDRVPFVYVNAFIEEKEAGYAFQSQVGSGWIQEDVLLSNSVRKSSSGTLAVNKEAATPAKPTKVIDGDALRAKHDQMNADAQAAAGGPPQMPTYEDPMQDLPSEERNQQWAKMFVEGQPAIDDLRFVYKGDVATIYVKGNPQAKKKTVERMADAFYKQVLANAGQDGIEYQLEIIGR